ncbi:hypothetical protein Tco_0332897 [Tanacetum coccineum]
MHHSNKKEESYNEEAIFWLKAGRSGGEFAKTHLGGFEVAARLATPWKKLTEDEEVLRETLEEQARAEKEREDRIKKEEAERELFILEFGVQTDSEYETD